MQNLGIVHRNGRKSVQNARGKLAKAKKNGNKCRKKCSRGTERDGARFSKSHTCSRRTSVI